MVPSQWVLLTDMQRGWILGSDPFRRSRRVVQYRTVHQQAEEDALGMGGLEGL